MTTLLPEHLRAARGFLDWSRDELALRSAVSRNTIARFEKGDPITQNNLHHIKEALKKEKLFFDGPNEDGVISVTFSISINHENNNT